MISKDEPGCREIRWEIVEGMKAGVMKIWATKVVSFQRQKC